MGFADGVAAGDEGDGFLVVHGHACEGFANVFGGGDGVRVSIWAFGVDVDEAHLDGGEGVFEVALSGVAAVGFVAGGEPFGFAAPVDVLIGFPDVFAAAAEAEGFEAGGFEGDVSGEDHEVCPGDFAAVFLFDGPEEAAGFIEVAVVWPRVEWCEALLSATAAAAAIAGAVGAGAVPCHADEEAGVGAEVRGPPVLGVGHEGGEVFFEAVVVDGFEFGRVVEIRVHGVGFRGVLVEEFEFELVGPPIAVGGAGGGCAVVEGAFGRCGSIGGWERCLLVVHVSWCCLRMVWGEAMIRPVRRLGFQGNVTAPW